jgi:hypothetical protein
MRASAARRSLARRWVIAVQTGFANKALRK